MLHNRLVDQLGLFNRFPGCGLENLFFNLSVNLERHADLQGQLFFGASVFKLFVLFEKILNLAMVLFEEIDRGHLFHTRPRGFSLVAVVNASHRSLGGHRKSSS
jgi:hypothetical protein